MISPTWCLSTLAGRTSKYISNLPAVKVVIDIISKFDVTWYKVVYLRETPLQTHCTAARGLMRISKKLLCFGFSFEAVGHSREAKYVRSRQRLRIELIGGHACDEGTRQFKRSSKSRSGVARSHRCRLSSICGWHWWHQQGSYGSYMTDNCNFNRLSYLKAEVDLKKKPSSSC